MALRWRDVIATAAVLVVLLITYALLRGLEWPILIDWRTGTFVLLVLGSVTSRAVATEAILKKGVCTTASTILGVVAVGLSVDRLIFNTQ